MDAGVRSLLNRLELKTELWILGRALYKTHNALRGMRFFGKTQHAYKHVLRTEAILSTWKDGDKPLANPQLLVDILGQNIRSLLLSGAVLLSYLRLGQQSSICMTLLALVSRIWVMIGAIREVIIQGIHTKEQEVGHNQARQTLPAHVPPILGHQLHINRELTGSSKGSPPDRSESLPKTSGKTSKKSRRPHISSMSIGERDQPTSSHPGSIPLTSWKTVSSLLTTGLASPLSLLPSSSSSMNTTKRKRELWSSLHHNDTPESKRKKSSRS